MRERNWNDLWGSSSSRNVWWCVYTSRWQRWTIRSGFSSSGMYTSLLNRGLVMSLELVAVMKLRNCVCFFFSLNRTSYRVEKTKLHRKWDIWITTLYNICEHKNWLCFNSIRDILIILIGVHFIEGFWWPITVCMQNRSYAWPWVPSCL